MICSFSTEKNMEITICTSECMIVVYITMTHKMKTFCLSTQSQATIKFKARNISRLINKQGDCMRLLVTHHLRTTSKSYIAIKTRTVQWRYKTLMWLTTYGARVSHIWKEMTSWRNLSLWQATWYRFWKIWWSYIKASIWRQICSLLTLSLYFST